MILKCDYAKKELPLIVVSTLSIEVDDCDADSIINDPSMLDADQLLCIAARAVSPKAKVSRK